MTFRRELILKMRIFVMEIFSHDHNLHSSLPLDIFESQIKKIKKIKNKTNTFLNLACIIFFNPLLINMNWTSTIPFISNLNHRISLSSSHIIFLWSTQSISCFVLNYLIYCSLLFLCLTQIKVFWVVQWRWQHYTCAWFSF